MTEAHNHTAGPERTIRPGRRGTLLAVGTFLVGVVGLVFGALPSDGVEAGHDHSAASKGGVVAGDIRVYGAYIREPASPEEAAAYLSIENDGTRADRLLSASSGASGSVSLHGAPQSTTNGASTGTGGTPRVDEMTPSGPITISGGRTVTLAPARGHLMLERLPTVLRPGDRVSLLLTFERAGQVLLEAPVIPIAAPAPTVPSGAPSTQAGTR